MLWIGMNDQSALIAEMERRTGLKATVSNGTDLDWEKDLDRFRVIVLDLPVSRDVVRQALAMTQENTAPLLIHDRDRLLDESLVRPPATRFQYITNRDPEELAKHIRVTLAASAQTGASPEDGSRNWLVGESRPMQTLRALIRLVAPRNSTVLLTGETGTGKERVARAIHAASQRKSAELVAVNCGALPEHLVEAELFGHTKGAFTGAAGPRVGRFEQAHKATLFLDEVGEIPMALQAKLLRVLQERELQRVGSSDTLTIDTRVIAATNANLAEAMAQKRFREDLYYRLNVVPIHVPPLRARCADIPMLAEYFIGQVCRRENLPVKALSEEATQYLMGYSWPGNVRQLEHVIETAVALSGNRHNLFLGDISLPRPAQLPPAGDIAGPEGSLAGWPSSGVRFEEVVGRVEKLLLDQALQSCGGNKARAASLLGMKRTTLLYKMKAREAPGCAA